MATEVPGLPKRARGSEQRLDGWVAVKAGAERMRVLRESLGHPTALGNLKLKVDVQVGRVISRCWWWLVGGGWGWSFWRW